VSEVVHESTNVQLAAHLTCLRIVTCTVLVGAVLAHGKAFSYDGRLSGAVWPIAPTQVADYAAVLLGCTSLLWFAGLVGGRAALLSLLGAGAAIVGAHTRTALLAMTISLVVAGASRFLEHPVFGVQQCASRDRYIGPWTRGHGVARR
jgi:hypothetical protein